MSAVRSCSRWIGVFLTALLGFAPGCETDNPPDTGGLSDYFENNPYESASRTEAEGFRYIRITPSSASVNTLGQVVRFQVDGGTGPYIWTVSAPANGRIIPSRQNEALYTVYQLAPNDVMVFDIAGRSAVAEIKAPAAEPEPEPPPIEPLTASAEPSTLAADGARSVLTASGGVPPYTWTLQDSALGSLDSSTGASVVYTRNRRGDNAARVTDSAGSTVAVVIQQP